jgi:outer membrane immunogenic protein
MRKLLQTMLGAVALPTLSLAANAADIRVRPPAYVPPPFSWTGFYIGGNLGGAWYQSNVTDNLFGLVFHNPSNNGVFIGGGQVGFNYQFSNIAR